MKKFNIKNSNGLNISAKFYKGNNNKPVILCIHGFRGRMSQRLFILGAQYLKKEGFNVLKFDATNHIGESDGDLFNFTISGFLDDINSVINFVKENNLDKNGIILLGHSLGGAVELFVHDLKSIKGYVFLSAPLFLSSNGMKHHRDFLSENGKVLHFRHKDLNYDISSKIQEDFKNYTQENLDNKLREITKPKLFLYMENDEAIPKESFENGFNISSDPKNFIIVPNSNHNPKTKKEIKFISESIKDYFV